MYYRGNGEGSFHGSIKLFHIRQPQMGYGSSLLIQRVGLRENLCWMFVIYIASQTRQFAPIDLSLYITSTTGTY